MSAGDRTSMEGRVALVTEQAELLVREVEGLGRWMRS